MDSRYKELAFLKDLGRGILAGSAFSGPELYGTGTLTPLQLRIDSAYRSIKSKYRDKKASENIKEIMPGRARAGDTKEEHS